MPDPIKLLRYPLFAIAVFISINAYSQDRNQFKGKVVDSINHVPIELATVAVMTVKDSTSTLFAYVLTDKKGEFIIHNLPVAQNLKLLISVMGYNSYRKFLTLKSKTESIDFGTIGLSNKQLKEITIKDRPPIVIRADTIEFAAEAFKVRPNAVVEDLLKKLPGVEVSGNGAITVAGKPVTKVYVDGHEYFANDQRIATRNLDVDLIDKVQVYDDREDDPNHLVPDADVNKIINLKFKKQYKKSIFGKLFAGAGTEDRYETGGLVNLFRDTLQVSLLGVSNNLNNTGFSYSDLQANGGLNRGGSDAAARAGINFFGSSGTTGIQKIVTGGININNDYGKKLKVNVAWYYNHLVNDYNSLSNTQRLLNDTTLTSRASAARLRYDTRNDFTTNVRWQPNNETMIQYNPSISIDNNSSGSSNLASTFSNFVPIITRSATADNSNGNNVSFSQNFSYNHQFKNFQSFSVNHSFSVAPSNTNDYNINQVNSYTSLLSSYLLNRHTNSNNKATTINLGASYNASPFKNTIVTVSENTSYRHAVNNTFAFDLDTLNGQYDLPVVNLSSALTRNSFSQSVTPGVRYNFVNKKHLPVVQLSASLNLQLQQIDNQFDRGAPDLNQRFFTASPAFNVSAGKFGGGYSETMSLPNIGDLIPYTVVYSPLYSVTGNPDLKPTYRHNFNARYTRYSPQNRSTVIASVGYTIIENSVFRQRTLDQAGIETSRPVNADGAYNLNGSVNFSKPIKKSTDLTISSSSSINVSKYHSFFELNGQNGMDDSYNGSISESINFNWKDKIEMSPFYNLNTSVIRYSGIDYPNQSLISHAAGSHFIFYWTNRVSVEGSYNYNYNPLVPPGFQKSANLLSMNIAHTLFRNGKGQIKLTCFDILNQSVSTSRSVNENVITDSQSEILRRYFLLTFQYGFLKSLTKK